MYAISMSIADMPNNRLNKQKQAYILAALWAADAAPTRYPCFQGEQSHRAGIIRETGEAFIGILHGS